MKVILYENIFNKVYLPYLNDYSKFLMIFYGGASSGKSKFIAQRNIYNLMRGGRNYFICRKIGADIKNTVFAEYKKVIYESNLKQYFKINESDFTFTYLLNGFKMIFKGLDDVEKIKSFTFQKGNLTDIHIEEATQITQDDYEQLELRMRGITKYKNEEIKKQIIMSFNPIYESHWIKKKFFDIPNNNVFILKTTYKDNVFLSEQDVEIIESKKNNSYFYKVYALGEWGVLGSLVFHNWHVEDLRDIEDKLDNYSVGLDFGFSNDPTVIIKGAYHNKKIYILKEFYQKGVLNSDIAKIIKNEYNGFYIWCDSAEPKSIRELQLYGLAVLPVKKGKDSVIHGIQWLQQHEIIIDKSCVHTIEEFQTYKYKEDRDKNILNEPQDFNNHCIDAVRYLTEYIRLSMGIDRNLSYKDLGI